MKSIYDISVQQVDGTEKSLAEYKGKVILIVNTASKCGFTRQLASLQSLYDKYKEKHFVVLAFPCDQFQNQEFENINDTVQFCETNFGVTFPVFSKIKVNGREEHPLYTFLKKRQKGMITKSIKWNFTKFLVDRSGNVTNRYAPMTKPEQIEKDILLLITHNL